MTDPIRLSKRLIELVGCSRREAELFIEGGWVTVDGEVIDEPQFKVGTQKVVLDPEAKATVPEPVTLLLHAPAGVDIESAQQLLSPDTLSEEHRFSKRPLKGHFLRLSASADLQAHLTARTLNGHFVVRISLPLAPPASQPTKALSKKKHHAHPDR